MVFIFFRVFLFFVFGFVNFLLFFLVNVWYLNMFIFCFMSFVSFMVWILKEFLGGIFFLFFEVGILLELNKSSVFGIWRVDCCGGKIRYFFFGWLDVIVLVVFWVRIILIFWDVNFVSGFEFSVCEEDGLLDWGGWGLGMFVVLVRKLLIVEDNVGGEGRLLNWDGLKKFFGMCRGVFWKNRVGEVNGLKRFDGEGKR